MRNSPSRSSTFFDAVLERTSMEERCLAHVATSGQPNNFAAPSPPSRTPLLRTAVESIHGVGAATLGDPTDARSWASPQSKDVPPSSLDVAAVPPMDSKGHSGHDTFEGGHSPSEAFLTENGSTSDALSNKEDEREHSGDGIAGRAEPRRPSRHRTPLQNSLASEADGPLPSGMHTATPSGMNAATFLSSPANVTVVPTARPVLSTSSLGSDAAVAPRESAPVGLQEPPPTPIFASTITNTALAMLSAVLTVENRHPTTEPANLSSSLGNPSLASLAAAAGPSNGTAIPLRKPTQTEGPERSTFASMVRPPSVESCRSCYCSDVDGGAAEMYTSDADTAVAPGLGEARPPSTVEWSRSENIVRHQSVPAVAVEGEAAQTPSELPPLWLDAVLPAEESASIDRGAAVGEGVFKVEAATAAVVEMTNTTTLPPHSTTASPSQDGLAAAGSVLDGTDTQDPASVGGHHFSVTEGNAFLKQSGSRREEAFYNMIQPYQEVLVREAVRQAPHTVQHHYPYQASTSGSKERCTATQCTTEQSRSPPLRFEAGSRNSSSGEAVVANADDVKAIGEARWEAYQQFEAEDLSNLNILASAQPVEEPRRRLCSEEVENVMEEQRGSGAAEAATTAAVTPPPPPVDKDLVELAARLWWTVQFRHFYRNAAAAYVVQRQAAEAARLSPPPPCELPPTSATEEHTPSEGRCSCSRCVTPVSLSPMPLPSPSVELTPRPAPTVSPFASTVPVASRSDGEHRAAWSCCGTAATPTLAFSGSTTPRMAGSLATPSSDGAAITANTGEHHYAAQKHRALQLLAAFVPRYHGTRCLLVRDVLLRRERLAAGLACAASAPTATLPSTSKPDDALEASRDAQLCETARQQKGTLIPVEERARENLPDGQHICRMILLEYVCYRFRRQCVMDIKMGSRQYGLHPSLEKKRSKERKARLSTSERYGIRLAGYRRWNAEEARYDFRSKLQCRSLSLHEVKSEISKFLMNSREMEHIFVKQLQRLRVAFSQQTVFRFYTSSLLFVYDAEEPLTTARVVMVDFAYTYESKELQCVGDPDAEFAYDVGYLKAIDTLLSLLA